MKHQTILGKNLLVGDAIWFGKGYWKVLELKQEILSDGETYELATLERISGGPMIISGFWVSNWQKYEIAPRTDSENHSEIFGI